MTTATATPAKTSVATQPRRQYNPARTREMVAMRAAGMTNRAIGLQFGLTEERVRQLVATYSVLDAQESAESEFTELARDFAAARRQLDAVKVAPNLDKYLRDIEIARKCDEGTPAGTVADEYGITRRNVNIIRKNLEAGVATPEQIAAHHDAEVAYEAARALMVGRLVDLQASARFPIPAAVAILESLDCAVSAAAIRAWMRDYS